MAQEIMKVAILVFSCIYAGIGIFTLPGCGDIWAEWVGVPLCVLLLIASLWILIIKIIDILDL
jgi:hypothetical protein